LAASGPAVVTDIVREGRQWRDRRLDGVIQRAAAAALQAAGVEMPGIVEISILLTNDNGIRALNRAWRGVDKPTNVLSFPTPPGVPAARRHLGDMALAFETLESEAADEGKAFADHLSHLVVHAVLHLVGYDHAADADAADMEAREVDALARLGIADPYADRERAAVKRAKA
jgi:probable rRNA maturation factor